MNIIFAGTPEFASTALQSLIDAGHTISLVLTKPDAISGRGMTLRPTAVKTLALQHNLHVEQPKSLRNEEAEDLIRSVNADLMVVAAYGLILPSNILSIPTLGCLNIHGSLLPRWRGAAPIQRAILAGDSETGITIIQMDSGLDTGDILSTYPLNIKDDDTSSSLYEKMSYLGGSAIVDTLSKLSSIAPQKQTEEGMTYADKITKEEAKIDFTKSGKEIELAIRSYNPFPGAFVMLDDCVMKIWNGQFVPTTDYFNISPGTIIEATSSQFAISVLGGILCLKTVQLVNHKKMTYDAFVAGRPHLLNKVLM